MRRKKKNAIKKLIRIIILIAVFFAVMKLSDAAPLAGLSEIKDSVAGVLSLASSTAEQEVDTLKKIVEEYTASVGDSSALKSGSAAAVYSDEVIKKEAETAEGVTAAHGVVVTERLEGLEIPAYISGHPVVQKFGYALSYNHQQPTRQASGYEEVTTHTR